MKLGILQCGYMDQGIADKHGRYDALYIALLAGNDFEYETHMVVDNEFPSSVDDCDGWLVTGSIHGAYADLEWIATLEEFIRQSYDRNIPLVGICFGHQIMAQALGGRVEKFSGGWGLGHVQYTTVADNSKVGLYAMHQDQVVETPPEASIIASTDFCANAALAYKGTAISFQPHPEFTPELMRDLLVFKMGNGIPRDICEAALATLSDDNDNTRIAAQIGEFFQSAGKSERASQAAE